LSCGWSEEAGDAPEDQSNGDQEGAILGGFGIVTLQMNMTVLANPFNPLDNLQPGL
jgi:hypothetical protein